MGGGPTHPTTPTVQNGETIYPLLTEEVTYPLPTTPGPTGVPGGPPASLGQIVSSALRDVLGLRPSTSNPKAFISALTQSFSGKDIEGHVEYSWTGRTGLQAPADLGAFGMVQASIYSQAQAMVNQALPLLEGLYSLRVDIDAKEQDAVRAIVRTRLNEIVAELGREDGPRVQNVDKLFEIITGVSQASTAAGGNGIGTVLGLLRRLQNMFGLEASRVETLDEERNLTNFLILVDSINALRLTWGDQRNYFLLDGDARAPLSTRLPRLWRHLDFLAERLQYVYFAMDSVFLGPAERQVVELDFALLPSTAVVSIATPGDYGKMFLSDLLDWLHDMASGGGRSLIDDGGREGVSTFWKTIEELDNLFSLAAAFPDPTPGIPPAYFTPRVQDALAELASELDKTLSIAKDITDPLPDFFSIEPLPPITPPIGLVAGGGGPVAGVSGRLVFQLVGKGFYDGMGLSTEVTSATGSVSGEVVVVNSNLAYFFSPAGP